MDKRPPHFLRFVPLLGLSGSRLWNAFESTTVAMASNSDSAFDSWFENKLVLELPEQLFVDNPEPPIPTPRFRHSERKLTPEADRQDLFCCQCWERSLLSPFADKNSSCFSIERNFCKGVVLVNEVPLAKSQAPGLPAS
jgi:hypothetical protein